MMGPSHALSGAALWLGGTATYTYTTGTQIDPIILIMGTAVAAGAAIAPDLDSSSATITKSFGIFGKLFYHITNGVSLLLYNLTKTKYDSNIENGHRTLTHTVLAAIAAGLIVLGITSLPGSVTIGDKTFLTGQLGAILCLAFFLHLGQAGLFAPLIKKARAKVGPYILIIITLTLTTIIAAFLPTYDTGYQWLAIIVTVGYLTHILGDLITKKGVPALWPIKIRGKRWYDVSLPSALRITTGGAVENAVLLPAFGLITALGAIAHGAIMLNLI